MRSTPGKRVADRVQDPDQALLRDDEGSPSQRKRPVHPSETKGGVLEILHDFVEALDAERLSLKLGQNVQRLCVPPTVT
jgi:hypothetical protein